MTEVTLISIAKSLWHIERKITEVLERVKEIEAMLSSRVDPDDFGPDITDTDWVPATRHEEVLR